MVSNAHKGKQTRGKFVEMHLELTSGQVQGVSLPVYSNINSVQDEPDTVIILKLSLASYS